MKRYKIPGKYVTFDPTQEEFSLLGTIEGFAVFTTDSKYLDYGFKLASEPDEEPHYYFVIDTPEKTWLFSNVHELWYRAFYKGALFGVRIDPVQPTVTLVPIVPLYPQPDFEMSEQDIYHKAIAISEVTIITVRETIDLIKFMPNR